MFFENELLKNRSKQSRIFIEIEVVNQSLDL